MSLEKGTPVKSRRQALALAAALALTVVTAVVAVAGMPRGASPTQPAASAVAAQTAPRPAYYERGDD